MASVEGGSLEESVDSEEFPRKLRDALGDEGSEEFLGKHLSPDEEIQNDGKNSKRVILHGKRMETLTAIRSINCDHRKIYEEQRLDHIKSPLTQPSLASRCETLNKSYRSNWYKRILLNCNKIDERISQLNDSIHETKKRLRDSQTNIITSIIAFLVILINGIIDKGSSSSAIITNLSTVLLNILLAVKALFEAREDRAEQNHTESALLEEYKAEMWEIDRYIESSLREDLRARKEKRNEET